MACSRLAPHISGPGASELHTAGRSGRPNRRQRISASSWGHAMPAGLPCGKPGRGLLIDGAVQQAAQPGRQGVAGARRDARVMRSIVGPAQWPALNCPTRCGGPGPAQSRSRVADSRSRHMSLVNVPAPDTLISRLSHWRLWVYAGLALLLGALVVQASHKVMAELSYDQIVAAVRATPASVLLLSVLATAVSYFALTFYDRSALAYAG
eukprot:gene36295-47236_t